MEPEKKALDAPKSSSGPKIRNWLIVGALALVGSYFFLGGKVHWPFGAPAPAAPETPAAAAESGPPTVELSGKQLQAIKIGKVGLRDFRIVKPAVGNVDFNQDRSTQVSSPYQGRILEVFVYLGDRVTRGQPLFTIESPDLMTASSTLIQTAGVLDLTNANLTRLRGATKIGGAAQKDLDQVISDQKTADGAYKAARLALTVFGKTEEEIDQAVRERRVDHALVVRSPVDGVVSSRVAAPGLLVQPGNAPTPITVSDDKTLWLNAYAVESDALLMRPGQQVVVKIPAAEEEIFTGKVTRVGGAVDPATHRLLVRSVIDDPDHKLRAGMIASFEITLDTPMRSPSIPTAGVVREGDGTMTAWAQTDATHFVQRVVKLGIQQEGDFQVLDGLKEGDTVIVEGAVFVDNILNAPPSD
jgi:cobalt-zinc-cadmium efflux system membrane fusion protein